MFWSVAAGAGAGGLSRYYLATLIQQHAGASFPLGTLIVNITGSFVLGFIMRYAAQSDIIGTEARVFLTSGFCGGYTTFSTFSYETALMFEDGQFARASTYVVTSVVVALLATFCGFMLARELIVFRARF
jgi:fluoride exporter